MPPLFVAASPIVSSCQDATRGGRPGHQIDPVYLAVSKLRKRQFDACIEICTNLLAENPLDQVRGQLLPVVVPSAPHSWRQPPLYKYT